MHSFFFTNFFRRTIKKKVQRCAPSLSERNLLKTSLRCCSLYIFCWRGLLVSPPPAKLKEENRLLKPLPCVWSWAPYSEKQKRSHFVSLEDNFLRLLRLIFQKAQQCLSGWLYLNSWGCKLFFRLTPCTGFFPLSVPSFLSVSFFSSNKTLLSSLAEITGGGVMRYICFPVLSYTWRGERCNSLLSRPWRLLLRGNCASERRDERQQHRRVGGEDR